MKRFAFVSGILLALAASSPAAAADFTRWKLFGAMAYVSPLAEDDVTIGSITDSVQASSEAGWEAGIEFRIIKIIGVEVSYLDVTQDLEASGSSLAEVDFQPYNLALNFHLFPSKYFDLYIGPVVSFVDWGDIKLDNGSSVEADSETAYGAAVGLDISFHKNFAFIGGVRWLSLDLTADQSGTKETVGVDPLISRVGFAFRW